MKQPIPLTTIYPLCVTACFNAKGAQKSMERREDDRLKKQQPDRPATGQNKGSSKAILARVGGGVGIILAVLVLTFSIIRNYATPVSLMPELWEEISGDVLLDEASTQTALLELKVKLQRHEEDFNYIVANDFSTIKQSLLQWATDQIDKEEVKGYIAELWAEEESGFQVSLEGQLEEIFTDVRASMLLAVDQIGTLIGPDLDTLEEKGPRRSVLLLGEKQLAFFDFSSPAMVNYIRRQIAELYRVIAEVERGKQVGTARLAKIGRAVAALEQYVTFETRTRADRGSGHGLVPAAKEVYKALNNVRLRHDTYWDEKLTGIPQERILAALEELNHRKASSGTLDGVRVAIPLGLDGELVIEPYSETTVTLRGPLAALKVTNL